MMKQISKKFKKVTSAALAMALGIGMALPTLALPDGWMTGDEDTPLVAVITKDFRMPFRTLVPEIKFEFDFTALEVDGSTLKADVDEMPEIPSVKVEFNNSDTAIRALDAQGDPSGVQYIMRETENILPKTIAWQHAGIYKYSAVENQTIELPKENAGNIEEILIKSQAEYEMEILVAANKKDSGFHVAGLAVRIIKGDEGQPASGKKDATPGGPTGGDGKSEFRFRNIYVKNNGKTDPEDPKDLDKFTVLDINKKVDGEFANTDRFFEFLVTVNKAEIGVEDTLKYRAYILNILGNNNFSLAPIDSDTTSGKILKDGENRDYIEFSTGVEVSVNLKHNQRLAFTDLPVGTSFTVTEKASLNYLPSYFLSINGSVPAKYPGENNKDLTVPKEYIGEAANSAAFVNEYEYTPTTGITVDNMPYIVMIALAMFALAGFTAVKYRRGLKFQA
ncbi:MAG: DUF5979 domain-containing protein [Oscillospiraceae bacterium]|nr:DUF5979 domain-containing protein [Oscillospiraceae bacterium]